MARLRYTLTRMGRAVSSGLRNPGPSTWLKWVCRPRAEAPNITRVLRLSAVIAVLISTYYNTRNCDPNRTYAEPRDSCEARSSGLVGRACASAKDRMRPPRARQTLERVLASVFETESRACDQTGNNRRYEHLSGTSQSSNPRPCVHGDASHLVAD
jgi:hypothetical protein